MKLAIVGAVVGDTMKLVLLVAVPEVVVTEIGPVVAPVGTLAFTLVADTNTNPVPMTPLNLTVDVFVKFVPLITTSVPTGPEVGERVVTVGAGVANTVNVVGKPAAEDLRR